MLQTFRQKQQSYSKINAEDFRDFIYDKNYLQVLCELQNFKLLQLKSCNGNCVESFLK